MNYNETETEVGLRTFGINYFMKSYANREIAVGIVTRYKLDDSERQNRVFFSTPKRPYWLLGPASHLFNGNWGAFQETKRPERKVNYSLPSTVEVENERLSSSTPCIRISWRGQGQLFP